MRGGLGTVRVCDWVAGRLGNRALRVGDCAGVVDEWCRIRFKYADLYCVFISYVGYGGLDLVVVLTTVNLDIGQYVLEWRLAREKSIHEKLLLAVYNNRR